MRRKVPAINAKMSSAARKCNVGRSQIRSNRNDKPNPSNSSLPLPLTKLLLNLHPFQPTNQMQFLNPRKGLNLPVNLPQFHLLSNLPTCHHRQNLLPRSLNRRLRRWKPDPYHRNPLL
jgi:hypothetical protein